MALQVNCTVEIKDVAARLVRVAIEFRDLLQPYLDLAFPVWTPGVYARMNYALNVHRFTARAASGARLRAIKVRPSAWRIDTLGTRHAVVEFDYAAAIPGWNRAGVTAQYAFVTGVQLFPEPVGHRARPSTVRFVAPAGWRIASALRETADPAVFIAADYDELADAPTLLGSFESVPFQFEGKRHVIVTASADGVRARDAATFVPTLQKIIGTQRAVFGSLPYEKYVFFFFPRASGFSGANLEHSDSSVYAGALDEIHPADVAHEFFHLWNGKRLRPSEMCPYDYACVNPGPSLWVSEGITSYYAARTLLWAGLETWMPNATKAGSAGSGPEGVNEGAAETEFLRNLAWMMSEAESHPERPYVSPSDASVSGGLSHGATGLAFVMGHVLGALLDLSIRHDTEGRRGLDDVMRGLYARHPQERGGFRPEDVLRLVNDTAGRDYADFFHRHVTGTETPPYERLFGYGGYRVVRSQRTLGCLELAARRTAEGWLITWVGDAASPAARAGLCVGDVIVSADGVPLHQATLANLFEEVWQGGCFLGRAGESVVLRVRRGGGEHEIAAALRAREEISFRFESDPAATAAQHAIRAAWLKRAS